MDWEDGNIGHHKICSHCSHSHKPSPEFETFSISLSSSISFRVSLLLYLTLAIWNTWFKKRRAGNAVVEFFGLFSKALYFISSSAWVVIKSGLWWTANENVIRDQELTKLSETPFCSQSLDKCIKELKKKSTHLTNAFIPLHFGLFTIANKMLITLKLKKMYTRDMNVASYLAC